jgi:hypothetical protein
MATTFETDPGRRRCTIRLTGVISLADLKAGVRTQIDAGVWTWDTVVDATGATGTETTAADIVRVTNMIDGEVTAHHLPSRGPVVIVVPDPHSRVHELARQYQVMAMNASGLRIELVRRVADADTAFARLGPSARPPSDSDRQEPPWMK